MLLRKALSEELRGRSHYVVTEVGIAALHRPSVRNRAQSLVNVARPDFREGLAPGI